MDSIDFRNTKSCQFDKQCELNNYNFKKGSKDSVWECKNNKCILNCYSDKDCGKDGLCDNNICRNKNYGPLMKGCLNEDNLDEFRKNETNANQDGIKSCIEWSRNQLSDKDKKSKYMIYREKKETPINWEKFNATISCKNGNNNYQHKISESIKNYCKNNESYDSCIYNVSNNYLNNIIKNSITEFNKCDEYKVKRLLF